MIRHDFKLISNITICICSCHAIPKCLDILNDKNTNSSAESDDLSGKNNFVLFDNTKKLHRINLVLYALRNKLG